jgi:hypothetical protein
MLPTDSASEHKIRTEYLEQVECVNHQVWRWWIAS